MSATACGCCSRSTTRWSLTSSRALCSAPSLLACGGWWRTTTRAFRFTSKRATPSICGRWSSPARASSRSSWSYPWKGRRQDWPSPRAVRSVSTRPISSGCRGKSPVCSSPRGSKRCARCRSWCTIAVSVPSTSADSVVDPSAPKMPTCSPPWRIKSHSPSRTPSHSNRSPS